eukprot:364929-Chlamydomonas_euryale.AAC.5
MQRAAVLGLRDRLCRSGRGRGSSEAGSLRPRRVPSKTDVVEARAAGFDYVLRCRSGCESSEATSST